MVTDAADRNENESLKFGGTQPDDIYIKTMNLGLLVPKIYDYIATSYPTTSTEIYVYKTGGVGGTTVATITIIYTDSSKTVLTSVART